MTSDTFESLSPTENADEDNHYFHTLNWALSNRKRKDIRNIALTGPYGSGKSSILKAFQKKCRNRSLRFLNISLATFKESATEGTGSIPEAELLRLIEVSILQQIFYLEEDKDIPDSRFKKIKSYGKIRLGSTALGLVLFIIALFNFFDPVFIQSIFKDYPFSQGICDIIHYSTYAILLGGLFGALLRSIRFISSITINTVKIQNAELSVTDNANKSILNNHLDEIVYFFEVTKYNVVIIEDLDRFQQTEIFTKLREINLLLNSSKKTRDQHIVFIYAVKDDMFINEKRTKFFDFIVPVIPIINSSNSSQIFLEKKKRNSYLFSDELIDDISLFIDDMRLVYNITNEFHLYRDQLDVKLDQNKMLSMIVYKNLFPYDFTLLAQNKGHLFEAINSRDKYINSAVAVIDAKIETLKAEISELQKVNVSNIADLRRIYVSEIIDSNRPFTCFISEAKQIDINAAITDGYFQKLVDGTMLYRHQVNYQSHDSELRKPFTEIEKKLHKKTYLERANQIEGIHAGTTEKLKSDIQRLEVQKDVLRVSRLKDILSKTPEALSGIKDAQARDLIALLLRNGYIAEDYLDYVSIFHEGSLARSDNQFLICVKSQRSLEPDYKLTKIEKLVKRINEVDFTSQVLLNFDLINFLLVDTTKHQRLFKGIFSRLSDESVASTKFINRFILQTPHTESFIRALCKSWPNIWKFVENESSYPAESRNRYLKAIVEFSDIEILKTIYANSNLKNTILDDPKFLQITANLVRLRQVIKTLDLKVTKIEARGTAPEILSFIFDNNHYALNVEMLKALLIHRGMYNEKAFETQNYYSILTSNDATLLKRISEQIDEYVIGVYLKIPTNVNEPLDTLEKLLNNDKISEGYVESIIEQVQTLVNLKTITSKDRRLMLLSEKKIAPTWENVLFCYNDSEAKFSSKIVAYLNDLETAKSLSKVKIPTDTHFADFLRALLLCNELDYDCYLELLNANPNSFPDLEIEELSADKVKALIEDHTLTFDKENIENIANHFPDELITFLEIHKGEFLSKPESVDLDAENLKLILDSEEFTRMEKAQFLGKIPSEIVVSSAAVLRRIAKVIIADHSVPVPVEILETLLVTSEVGIADRMKVFSAKYSQVKQEITTAFLNSMGEPYVDITVNGKRPSLKNVPENLQLVKSLAAQGYISSFEEGKEKIKISTFRGNQNDQ